LQSLLADHDIELLAVAERQGSGIAFAPIDVRRQGARNGEHIRAEVNSDHVASVTEPLACNARHYSSSAGDVEDTIIRRQPYLFDSHLGPRPEQRSDKPSLV
jgi:hypothetical protein